MYSENETDGESTEFSEDNNIDISYYEPGEESLTKYTIVLCDLYNEKVHGIANNEIIKYNYLTINRYKTINSVIYDDAKYFNNVYNSRRNKNHNIFKNYKNIISNKNYIKPEIAECIYLLDEGQCISILKTFWIRLIQKTWKNIYKQRILINKKRYSQRSLKYREIYGKWPEDCIEYPKLRGMLRF
jgi:hypothetical protein